MDIAGIIGDGAWTVVKNILTLGIFALIIGGCVWIYISKRKEDEEQAFAEGRAVRLPDKRVLIFQTFERRQKYEDGLYNEQWKFYYDDHAQKEAHESGVLVLHQGKLVTPEQKVQEERRLEEEQRREQEQKVQEQRRLEETRRREEERRNRPRRRAMSSQERADIRDVLYRKQQGKCFACGVKLQKQFFHIDHKVPVAQGGSDELRNFQLLCPTCNTSKGARSQREFLSRSSAATTAA